MVVVVLVLEKVEEVVICSGPIIATAGEPTKETRAKPVTKVKRSVSEMTRNDLVNRTIF